MAGLPCPGCGVTTSLLALGRADIGAAWHANPAGAGVAVLLGGQRSLPRSRCTRRRPRGEAWRGCSGSIGWRSAVC
ncbi:MAG: DUF2752 domain-containing protein [Vicinamibacteraceae bacterium]